MKESNLWQWGLAEGLFSLVMQEAERETDHGSGRAHAQRAVHNIAAKGPREKQIAAAREHRHKGALLDTAAKRGNQSTSHAAASAPLGKGQSRDATVLCKTGLRCEGPWKA